MAITEEHLRELLEKHIRHQLTETEKQELFEAIREDELLFMRMAESVPVTFGPNASFGLKDREGILAAIFSTSNQKQSPVRMIYPWLRWVAAAIVILSIGIVAYLWKEQKSRQPVLAITQHPGKNNIIPGEKKAVLILADGNTIILDSTANGTIAVQGKMKIQKFSDGRVAYLGDAVNEKMQYNILDVPRGSQVVNMTLNDGSRVWLNAGSSIKFPIAFTGNDRAVEITGEVYFEVAKDASRPFIVKKKNSDTHIQVLGTHFNINAYDDEPAMQVTLLEGKVKIYRKEEQLTLQPGQQANCASVLALNNNADLEQVMSWKNGKFQFGEKADIRFVMRQISRWYDVDIVYSGTVDVHFGGSMSRQLNAESVLETLAMTGNVHFKTQGRTIIVMP